MIQPKGKSSSVAFVNIVKNVHPLLWLAICKNTSLTQEFNECWLAT